MLEWSLIAQQKKKGKSVKKSNTRCCWWGDWLPTTDSDWWTSLVHWHHHQFAPDRSTLGFKHVGGLLKVFLCNPSVESELSWVRCQQYGKKPKRTSFAIQKHVRQRTWLFLLIHLAQHVSMAYCVINLDLTIDMKVGQPHVCCSSGRWHSAGWQSSTLLYNIKLLWACWPLGLIMQRADRWYTVSLIQSSAVFMK